MVVRAVVFDIGGVLEKVEDVGQWLDPWRTRLGMTADAFEEALAGVDPDNLMQTGGMTEGEYRAACAGVLGLTDPQADEFLADMWDWYCGELDTELMAYATVLRDTHVTAILSNSADGARREEESRYSFGDVFDPIIYSHEVGLAKPDRAVYELTCRRLGLPPDQVVFLDNVQACVDGAREYGMHGVLHRDTRDSVARIDALLGS